WGSGGPGFESRHPDHFLLRSLGPLFTFPSSLRVRGRSANASHCASRLPSGAHLPAPLGVPPRSAPSLFPWALLHSPARCAFAVARPMLRIVPRDFLRRSLARSTRRSASLRAVTVPVGPFYIPPLAARS